MSCDNNTSLITSKAMDRIEIYKSLYYYELSRKEEHRTALGLPAGILALVGGVAGVYIKELADSDIGDFSTVILFIITFMLMVGIMSTLYYLGKSYHNNDYRRIPYVADFEKYYDGLRKHYEGDVGEEMLIDKEFESEFVDRIASEQMANSITNEYRTDQLYLANFCLLSCLVLVALGAVPYFFRLLDRNDEPQKVEIVSTSSYTPPADSTQ